MVRIGAGRFLLCGILALAASTTLLAFAETPWQLYAAYVLLAALLAAICVVAVISNPTGLRRGRDAVRAMR